MGNVTIYPKGTADITVPAGQSIAISNFGGGIAQIYYLITAANAPPAFQFQQILENSSVTLGAFSAETIVRIEANNSKVIYDVGVSPDTGIGDADTLNGLPSDTTDTADTIAARDSSGDIQANAFESTVATGTAPLTVASTTVVPNLNVSQLEGHGASYFAVDATVVKRASKKYNANVNSSTFWTIIRPNGDAITSSYSYRLTLTTYGTSANTGNVYLLTNTDGGGWDIHKVAVQSETSNNPSVFLDSGVPKVKTNHPTIYGVEIFIEEFESTAASNVQPSIWGSDFHFFSDGDHAYYRTLAAYSAYELYHTGNNPSVGAGNGISGSFTTTDGKTVTVTNGIITAIV